MGINFSKVAFTYNPQRKKEKNSYIIEDVNLSIKDDSEFICILGHTGSGKSTLVQMMNALLMPTIGEINAFDNVITNKKQEKLKEVRRKVGLVFQFPEYQLFEETVLKDVAFGPKNFKIENPEEKAKEALSLFNLGERFYNKNPFLLSGGEMRKVAISGILASNPDVLILDEPTVGLDPLTRRELVNLLKSINRDGKTVIIVTHDMDVVWDVATRVIVIDENKIVYDGNKYKLFKNEELVKKHSLDLPEIVKILKGLKAKLNIELDEYQDNLEKAYQAIVEAYNHE